MSTWKEVHSDISILYRCACGCIMLDNHSLFNSTKVKIFHVLNYERAVINRKEQIHINRLLNYKSCQWLLYTVQVGALWGNINYLNTTAHWNLVFVWNEESRRFLGWRLYISRHTLSTTSTSVIKLNRQTRCFNTIVSIFLYSGLLLSVHIDKKYKCF